MNTFTQKFFIGLGLLIVILGVYYLGITSTNSDSPAEVQTEPVREPLGKTIPFVNERDHMLGSPTAEIIFVVYSDFECPYCHVFHGTMQQVYDAYSNAIAWVYRPFPLDVAGPSGIKAHAAECVAELGGNRAFWQFTNAVFEKSFTDPIAVEDIPAIALDTGISEDEYDECMDSGRYNEYIRNVIAEAESVGVASTPGIFMLSNTDEQLYATGAVSFEEIESEIFQRLPLHLINRAN